MRTQVLANMVFEDTHKNISELEGAIAASQTENCIRTQQRDMTAQNNTTGAEEHNQEASSIRRTSPYKKKSNKWDWGGDERM